MNYVFGWLRLDDQLPSDVHVRWVAKAMHACMNRESGPQQRQALQQRRNSPVCFVRSFPPRLI